MQNKRIYSLSHMNQMISQPEAVLNPVVRHGLVKPYFELCCALATLAAWRSLFPQLQTHLEPKKTF